jgi:hypothetical protein
MERKTKKLISFWQNFPLYVFLIIETFERFKLVLSKPFFGRKFLDKLRQLSGRLRQFYRV